MRILGCDPGCHGGLALIEDGTLLASWLMPHVYVKRGKGQKAEVQGPALGELMRESGASHLFIEQVGGMTGQSASAAFNFGRAAGAPEYMGAVLGMVVTLVPPGNWKRKLNVMGGGKNEAVAKASRLFPYRVKDWSAWRGNGSADEREGRAEAALIAWYGWLELGGREPAAVEEMDDVFG